MDGKLEISLDKLPIKRVEFIEEAGAERFPPDVGYDEKRVDLIRRIDFAWAVEKDAKKQKKSSKDASTPWPWQNLTENLQLAHQELSVIIDLINTVEANDAVTVAGMTRPKPLPAEALSDLAVSAATKLQCFRHLGKYFKQSAKALEEQIAREGRFYGALIRLQQNWKVKRLRLAPNALSNEGFLFDLFDNLLRDPAAITRPSNSVVRVDHDSAGMLAVNIPRNSCRYIQFGFVDTFLGDSTVKSGKTRTQHPSKETKKELSTDDGCIKETHSALRETHRAIFSELVFELINREAFNPSLGVNVTGIKEKYLRLSINPGASVFISLVSTGQEEQKTDDTDEKTLETSVSPMDTSDDWKLVDTMQDLRTKLGLPNHIAYEIYLEQLFIEHLFSRGKDKPLVHGRVPSTDPTRDTTGLMSHFCMSLSHRIFANKVHIALENLVWRVPYLDLVSHPTWHARTSSWTLSIRVQDPKLHDSSRTPESEGKDSKNHQQLLFHTMVVVKDDCISIEGESAPNVIGPFNGTSEVLCSTNVFNCDLVELPMVLLFQITSEIICWLHEAALMVGIKANRDSLSLSFELDHGEMLSLVAHVDPEDEICCISWWLILEDGLTEERKVGTDVPEGRSTRRFLGYLSLDVLYATLMDLVSLGNGSPTH